MILALSIIAVVLCLSQLRKDDVETGAVMAATIMLEWIFNFMIESDIYYLANASIDLAAILIICLCKGKLVVHILTLLITSICLNAIGFFFYHAEMAPFLYPYLFVAWYVWLTYILISKGSVQWIKSFCAGKHAFLRESLPQHGSD